MTKHKSTSLHRIFQQYQMTIFGITFFLCSIIFIFVASFLLETYAIRSNIILTKALSERIQPALVFNDRITTNEIISEYAHDYPIRSIHVYNEKKEIFAETIQDSSLATPLQRLLDRLFFKVPVKLNIEHNNHTYGELVVYGNSSSHADFFKQIFIGFAISFFIVLFFIFWSVNSLYKRLMFSINPVLNKAHEISENKSYNLRFSESSIKEINSVNIAFNQLLEKIESSNKQLLNENIALSHQAHHDQLTNLPNRHYFDTSLQKVYDHGLQNTTALFFVDCNHFKEINDKYGHLAGDLVLKEFADRIQKQMRKDDFIARLGGDEFAIIIQDFGSIQNLKTICTHLLDLCRNPIDYQGIKIQASFCIGVALGSNAELPEDLLLQADLAMYKAKLLPEKWFISF